MESYAPRATLRVQMTRLAREGTMPCSWGFHPCSCVRCRCHFRSRSLPVPSRMCSQRPPGRMLFQWRRLLRCLALVQPRAPSVTTRAVRSQRRSRRPQPACCASAASSHNCCCGGWVGFGVWCCSSSGSTAAARTSDAAGDAVPYDVTAAVSTSSSTASVLATSTAPSSGAGAESGSGSVAAPNHVRPPPHAPQTPQALAPRTMPLPPSRHPITAPSSSSHPPLLSGELTSASAAEAESGAGSVPADAAAVRCCHRCQLRRCRCRHRRCHRHLRLSGATRVALSTCACGTWPWLHVAACFASNGCIHLHVHGHSRAFRHDRHDRQYAAWR